MSNKRVVVTGYGIVSCIGDNKKGLSIGYGDGQIIHKEKIIYHANDLRVGLFDE